MKRTHKQNGITLVALVITIIILLILAGISISALTNQGLFTQAQNAKNLTEEKTAEENEILKNYLEQMNAITGGTSGGTTYTAYAVGDQVTVGGESFYVIKASSTSEEKVTLLAAKNIDTTTMLQSYSAGTVAFSSTNYWSTIEGITYPYDLNNTATSADTDAIAKARAYGTAKGGTGRLMTVEEVVALGGDMDNYDSSACPSWINTSNYWLGSADNPNFVWNVSSGYLFNYNFSNDIYYGVRPVIEISKSLIS